MNSWIWIVLALVHLTWVAGELEEESEVEMKILQKIFLRNKFQMYVRPKPDNKTTDEPTTVSVSLYVLHIDIDTRKQECGMTMYFRQEWNDTRLSYDGQGKIKVLSIHDAVGFWTPDLFFVNEKSGHFHVLTKPNSFVRIYPQGKILFSQRLSVKLSCLMDLRKYPFDSQICTLPIESYGYTAEDLSMKWKPEVTFGINEPLGFQVSFSTSEEVIHMGENNYSRLELNIHLDRLICAHIIHVFLPLSFIVIVSWISFWISPFSSFPRLALSIVSIFAFFICFHSASEFFYPQTYLTAIDVWTAFSCFIIFGALFENIYVIVSQKGLKASSDNDKTLNQNGVPELPKKEKCKLTDILAGKLSIRASNIDLLARIAFPISFILFNCVYFGYFLI